MACCICHTIGVEIHHIVPVAEGGPDSEDNAAPLCPSCHETYGANPSKRKLIREARGLWYEICERRYTSDSDRLSRIESMLQKLVTCEEPPDQGSFSTLGETLDTIYNSRIHPVAQSDLEFFYDFVFGGVVGDEGVEETKRIFLERFGTETARRICAYELSRSDLDFQGGFTEDEIGRAAMSVIIVMLVFVYHQEIEKSDRAIAIRIEDNGDMRLWAANTLGGETGDLD